MNTAVPTTGPIGFLKTSPPESMPSKALHRYAIVVACLTFLLVLAGGLVTSTGSALAVPDWPLSFGQFFPRMEGGVLFEHGHRMIAGTVAILTLVLAVWLWRSEPRPGVRRLGLWALAAVVTQALLGGITVILRLPAVTSVSHACLAQIFFSLVVSIAVLTGSSAGFSGHTHEYEALKKLQRLALMTTGFIFLQLVAGATFRHTGKLFHLHLLGAVLVLIHVLLLARRVFQHYADVPELNTPAFLLAGLLGVQLALGYYSWKFGAIPITTVHVGVGALMLATSAVITLQSFRYRVVV